MIKYQSINGHLEPIQSAKIGVNDLGLLRGYAIFDYFQFQENQPVFMEDHLKRFFRSAKLMQLEIPFDMAALSDQIWDLFNANNQKDAGIRIVLTGGLAVDGYTPVKPNLLILQHELKRMDPTQYEVGARLILHEHVRSMPEVKTTSYFVAILLNEEIKTANATDVLYHNEAGWISETSRSNFFIVTQDDKLITPKDRILKGITRAHALEIAANQLPIEERDLNLLELVEAKEAFITSTTKGILPIVQVGSIKIGNGQPGEWTKKLGTLLREHTAIVNND